MAAVRGEGEDQGVAQGAVAAAVRGLLGHCGRRPSPQLKRSPLGVTERYAMKVTIRRCSY